MKIGKIINDCIPTRSNIDMGTNVIAMIVDTLSGRSPLYHVEKFYQDMDTELLFGFPISPKSFNDDALGRTLDRISTYGTQKLFTSISLQVVKDYNIVSVKPSTSSYLHIKYDTYDMYDKFRS